MAARLYGCFSLIVLRQMTLHAGSRCAHAFAQDASSSIAIGVDIRRDIHTDACDSGSTSVVPSATLDALPIASRLRTAA